MIGIYYTVLLAFGSIISSNWQDERSTLAPETSKKLGYKDFKNTWSVWEARG